MPTIQAGDTGFPIALVPKTGPDLIDFANATTLQVMIKSPGGKPTIKTRDPASFAAGGALYYTEADDFPTEGIYTIWVKATYPPITADGVPLREQSSAPQNVVVEDATVT